MIRKGLRVALVIASPVWFPVVAVSIALLYVFGPPVAGAAWWIWDAICDLVPEKGQSRRKEAIPPRRGGML